MCKRGVLVYGATEVSTEVSTERLRDWSNWANFIPSSFRFWSTCSAEQIITEYDLSGRTSSTEWNNWLEYLAKTLEVKEVQKLATIPSKTFWLFRILNLRDLSVIMQLYKFKRACTEPFLSSEQWSEHSYTSKVCLHGKKCLKNCCNLSDKGNMNWTKELQYILTCGILGPDLRSEMNT